MTDYDPLRDISHLLVTVLNWRTDGHEYADRIASNLGIGEDDTPRVVHEVLAKALRRCPQAVTFDLSGPDCLFVLTKALGEFEAAQYRKAADEGGNEGRERWAALAGRMREQAETAFSGEAGDDS